MTETLAASPLGRAIGVALVQFLWQGMAIGLIAAVALTALRRASAQTRYLVACLALVAMTIAPVVTAARAFVASRPEASASSHAAIPTFAVRPSDASAYVAGPVSLDASHAPTAPISWPGLPSLLDRYLPVVVLLWIAGVVLLSLHLLVTWILVERLRRTSTHPVADAWRERTMAIAAALRITRRIQVLESSLVNVPTVIGWLRPVILLPASALAGLSPSQLEAVIAHELAHIRRHDYLVNLCQSVVETLLFFHPVVWWISKRIRAEREHCCDDVAVTLSGNRLAYADALTSLAELRGGMPALITAATGGNLDDRIRRVLRLPAKSDRQSSAWLVAVIVITAVAAMPLGGMAKGTTRTATPPSSTPVKGTVAAQPSNVSSFSPAESQIRALEDQFLRAKLKNDVTKLAMLLDDAYVETNQNGNVYDKNGMIKLFRTFSTNSAVIHSSTVKFSGQTAVVMGKATEVSGQVSYHLLFTRVWRQETDGAWRLISCSQFSDPDVLSGRDRSQQAQPVVRNVSTRPTMFASNARQQNIEAAQADLIGKTNAREMAEQRAQELEALDHDLASAMTSPDVQAAIGPYVNLLTESKAKKARDLASGLGPNHPVVSQDQLDIDRLTNNIRDVIKAQTQIAQRAYQSALNTEENAKKLLDVQKSQPRLRPISSSSMNMQFQNADLADALRSFQRATGIQAYFSGDFKNTPRINVTLTDATPEEALAAITSAAKLAYLPVGDQTVLIVKPAK